mgnify:CR=1 FL=1
MRLSSILTALVVSGFLYLLVVDRERLFAIAQIGGAGDGPVAMEETGPDEPVLDIATVDASAPAQLQREPVGGCNALSSRSKR